MSFVFSLLIIMLCNYCALFIFWKRHLQKALRGSVSSVDPVSTDSSLKRFKKKKQHQEKEDVE